MRKRTIITILALLAGLSTSPGAFAGLNFAWLTASPVPTGESINIGSGTVSSELVSGVQTITAEVGDDFTAIKIDSIAITGNQSESDYSGTCTPGLELQNTESCTIQFAVTSDSPGNFAEQVNIGCSPVQAIGTTTISCTTQGVHVFHTLLARFFESAKPVPAMTGTAFTLMCLLILATGGYFGFRKN